MATADRIDMFIETLRSDVRTGHLDVELGNILTSSVRQWHRYRDFLRTVLSRYQEANATFMAAFHRHAEVAKAAAQGRPDSRSRTPDEWQEYPQLERFGCAVHLEVESFYIFAKVLLDRTADTFGHYFGEQWKGMGSTYSKLSRNFERIRNQRGLALQPTRLARTLPDLLARIVCVRDVMIEHLSEPRRIPGTAVVDGRATISMILLYPTSGDKGSEQPISTEALDQLLVGLDQYAADMLEFFEVNSAKSVFGCKHPALGASVVE